MDLSVKLVVFVHTAEVQPNYWASPNLESLFIHAKLRKSFNKM